MTLRESTACDLWRSRGQRQTVVHGGCSCVCLSLQIEPKLESRTSVEALRSTTKSSKSGQKKLTRREELMEGVQKVKDVIYFLV